MTPERTLYIYFYFLGMATLLPWNFFITPFAYWMTKLQRSDWQNQTTTAPELTTMATPLTNVSVQVNTNASITGKEIRMWQQDPNPGERIVDEACSQGGFEFNDLQKFWNSLLGIATMGTNLVFAFLTTILARKVSRSVRFIGCLIGYFICLSITLAMVKIDTEEWIQGFFGTTLSIVVVITICCAIFQTSLFGLASVFPDDLGIMVAVMGGQGCGGIFASVVNLVTLAVMDSPTSAAFVFFLLATIFTVAALYLYVKIMPSNELYKKYVLDISESGDKNGNIVTNRDEKPEEEAKLVSESTSPATEKNEITFIEFIKTTLWPYMVSVISVFVVTLSLFPAVAAFVRPSGYDCHSEYHTKWFVPIWCFTLFNVSDTIGRMMSGIVDFPKPGESKKLLFLCLARIGLMALFPMCNINPDARQTKVMFESDLVYILIMSVIGISGGILSGKAMAHASIISPPHLQDDTGNLMGTCLVAGLLGGAASSFIVLALI